MTETRTLPKAGETWRHFKGTLYEIVGVATHTETSESLVFYRVAPDARIWARPIAMFVDRHLTGPWRFTLEPKVLEALGIDPNPIDYTPEERTKLEAVLCDTKPAKDKLSGTVDALKLWPTCKRDPVTPLIEVAATQLGAARGNTQKL